MFAVGALVKTMVAAWLVLNLQGVGVGSELAKENHQ